MFDFIGRLVFVLIGVCVIIFVTAGVAVRSHNDGYEVGMERRAAKTGETSVELLRRKWNESVQRCNHRVGQQDLTWSAGELRLPQSKDDLRDLIAIATDFLVTCRRDGSLNQALRIKVRTESGEIVDLEDYMQKVWGVKPIKD